MANDFNEITNRLHSVRISDDPSTDHIVSGADEVYDDTAPYRTNGHITCNEVTPEGTENPKELNWYEKVIDTTDPTLFEWIKTNDEIVDSSKTYGIPTGARQNDINDQLYTMIGDISSITIESGEVVTADESKIINKEDGYIPTTGAVGRALGANFEDKLDSTSVAQGLTANMGRVLNEKKADINGYYETMSVGSANNLDGESTNDEAYLIRPTGGENNEVANGLASVVGIEGESVVWNQKVVAGNFASLSTWTHEKCSISISDDGVIATCNSAASGGNVFIRAEGSTQIVNHKYYISQEIKNVNNINAVNCGLRGNLISKTISNTWSKISFIRTSTTATNIYLCAFGATSSTPISVGDSIAIKNIIVIDLTLLGIDNLTTPVQVEEWLAQHVGTKPYYAYNEGEILSAKTLGIKTYNRNLLNPTTKQAKLIPYTHTTNSNKYTVKGIPTGAAVTYTPDNNGVAVDVTSTITDDTFDISSYGIGTLYIPNATANTYVCMKYDGSKDNDIVPYKTSTFNFDVAKVYGQINGEGDYVQCFPEGMKGIDDVADILTPNKAVTKIRISNLGSLRWQLRNADAGIFSLALDSEKTFSNTFMCAEYSISTLSATDMPNKSISTADTYNSRDIIIKNSAYHSVSEITSALNGIYLYSAYLTPITYTNLIYRDNNIDIPLKDILININVDNWSIEEQLLPDYVDNNPTSVPAKISTIYSIDAVAAIDELQKKSYFESDIHDNLQAMITCINTYCASVLGGQFSISETATNKLFSFNFTANASTNSTEENTETI